MDSHNRKFMEEAIRLSVENVESGNGGPFAALVVKNGQIISRGINRVTSTNDPTAHAEVVAIREACKTLDTYQLDDCEIYTSCEPCPMCLGAIYWARPRKIYFANTRHDAAQIGFDDSFIYDEISLPVTDRGIETEQLMRDEALSAFVAWQNKSDRIDY
jgi:tRNA(Arg) A34 adenosine deaminase TadA